MARAPRCRIGRKRDTPMGDWLRGLLAERIKNVVVVALANKLARIAWAVLRQGGNFIMRQRRRR